MSPWFFSIVVDSPIKRVYNTPYDFAEGGGNMAKNNNKGMASVVIAIIAAFAIGGAFTTWFHNDLLSIIGVLLGLACGWLYYRLS